jgi:hypothetical protein
VNDVDAGAHRGGEGRGVPRHRDDVGRPGARRRFSDEPMLAHGVLAELAHLAEHEAKPPPLALGELGGEIDARDHRRAVRVVAVVEEERSVREANGDEPPAFVAQRRERAGEGLGREALGREHTAHRDGSRGRVGTGLAEQRALAAQDRGGDGQRGERVGLVTYGATQRQLDARGVGTERLRGGDANIGVFGHPVEDPALRRGAQQLSPRVRVVAVHDRHTARGQRTQQRALLFRDGAQPTEPFAVRQRDQGQHGHVGLGERCGVGDLARARGPDLDHRRVVRVAQAEEHQGDADGVVEVARARMHRDAERAQQGRGGAPRRGLARRARDRHDPPREARGASCPAPPMRAGQVAEGADGVVDEDRGDARWRGDAARHDGHGSPLRVGRLQVVVAVETLADEGDEQVAALGVARVGAHPTRAQLRSFLEQGSGGRDERLFERKQRVVGGNGRHGWSLRARAPEGATGLDAVVEGANQIADDLVGLVALSSDEHGVSRLRLGYGVRDRLGAIEDGDERGPFGRDSSLDRGGDQGGLFAPRVVVRHHERVGAPGCGRAHQRTLVGIPIATAAENTMQPPRRQRAERGEDASERVGRVGVVDHDEHLVSGLAAALQASGHGRRRAQRREPRVERHAAGEADPQRDEQVLQVVSADQGGAQLAQLASQVHRRGEPRGVDANVARRELGGEPGRRHAQDLALRALAERSAERSVHTDHRVTRRELDEEPRLGGAIGLHRAVEIEVVLGQVGEGRDLEGQRVHTIEREGMARHLHHEVTAAPLDHRRQRARGVVALGRGVGRRQLQLAEEAAQRTEHRRPVTRGVEQRPREVGGGGLAVGARHAHDRQRSLRVPVGREREGADDRARVGDPERGQLQPTPRAPRRPPPAPPRPGRQRPRRRPARPTSRRVARRRPTPARPCANPGRPRARGCPPPHGGGLPAERRRGRAARNRSSRHPPPIAPKCQIS